MTLAPNGCCWRRAASVVLVLVLVLVLVTILGRAGVARVRGPPR